ncbi:hypothetical protein GM182_00965 [bacterium 3DAC]|nr:hypothetical protein [Dictyoglomota bacterium]UZN22515.1 hypothetical protein GM182_00965 [bacterium 3DAC]
MRKREMAPWFEYAGYAVLAYALLWGIWAFINPDDFEVFRGVARQMAGGGSMFFRNPTMAMYPLGYLIVLYIFGFFLVGWVTVYMGHMLRKRENPGSLVGMMLIVSVVFVWKFLSVMSDTPFLAAMGVVAFGFETVVLIMYYFAKE